MTDTLALFLASVDVAKVEAERFPSLTVAEREYFVGADHRAMLAVHAAETAKFNLSRRLAKVKVSPASIEAADGRLARRLARRARVDPPSIADSLAAHREQARTTATHAAA